MTVPTEFIIVGDSISANAVGRAISLAVTARTTGAQVELFAYDDGPAWPGITQFEIPVMPLDAGGLRRLIGEISERSRQRQVVVWISKGAGPLDTVARAIRRTTAAVVLADFDDDDIAIMKSFRSLSIRNRVAVHPLNRKHPARLRSSQRTLAHFAHGLTFSSATLSSRYAAELELPIMPTGIVPHTRAASEVVSTRTQPTDRSLRLGFFGTVRAHKGADTLVSILEADPGVTMSSFAQRWQPPASVGERWISHPADAPIAELYREIDFLVLPMSSSDPAATNQLPAKLVDAAMLGCPVASTPTAVIDEFARGAYLPIDNWSDVDAVLETMRRSDVEILSHGIQRVYERAFSPEATATALEDLLEGIHAPWDGRASE